MAAASIMNTYGERKLTFTKGEGCYLWDDQGNRYLDALSGIAVCGLGHCHPALADAISKQSQTLMHTSNLYLTEPPLKLAEQLCKITGMDSVFFSNSGAEANEAAIKIARKYGNDRGIPNPTIITMNGSFHGRTMATLSATGNPKVKAGFSPLVEGFMHLPYNDIQAVTDIKNDNVVAVFVEPVQGEGGVNIPDQDYLSELRKICDKNNWLLMLDEIQTGNCRTGKYFAFQHTNIEPDVLTTAKGLGNGLPIGACLAKGKASEVLQPGSHGSTYGGNPLVCQGALTVNQILEKENIAQNSSAVGKYLLEQFRTSLSNQCLVHDIRGLGMMIGIELTIPCTQLVSAASSIGLLINVTADKVIRLLPPLILTEEQADEIVVKLTSLINELEDKGSNL